MRVDPLGDTQADEGWLLADTAVSPGPAGRRRPSSRPPVVEPGPLGRYEVVRELGRGGMGVVVEARDPALGRRVALKLLHETGSARSTERLGAEARAMARLSHPNVVQVYEVGENAGRGFIAMELVDGRTLRRWQEERPGWRECVEAYLQAGAGLVAAHEAGLTHRDFKPDNCIIDAQGRVRVLDFGLVRGADDGEEIVGVDPSGPTPLAADRTEAGTLLGTPGYMALEQLNGRAADARSDQFGFCVALYEAIYGERPFVEDSLPRMMVAMKMGDVKKAPKGSRVPAELRRVLLRGLAPDPADRWPAMEVLLQQLRRVLARPQRFRTWQRWGMSAMVGLLSVLGAQRSEPVVGADVSAIRAGASGDEVDDGSALVSGVWEHAGAWSGVPLGERVRSGDGAAQ